MQAPHSFAPLAARLAARADEIRPADGAEVSWANFMALFVCAILYGLIALCEALDARAAAEALGLVAQASREAAAGAVPALRTAHRALPGAGRLPRLALVPDVGTQLPEREVALPGETGPSPRYPALAWTRHFPRRDTPAQSGPLGVPQDRFFKEKRLSEEVQACLFHYYIVMK